jgi:hypothetical protein
MGADKCSGPGGNQAKDQNPRFLPKLFRKHDFPNTSRQYVSLCFGACEAEALSAQALAKGCLTSVSA